MAEMSFVSVINCNVAPGTRLRAQLELLGTFLLWQNPLLSDCDLSEISSKRRQLNSAEATLLKHFGSWQSQFQQLPDTNSRASVSWNRGLVMVSGTGRSPHTDTWDLQHSQRCCRRYQSAGMWRRVSQSKMPAWTVLTPKTKALRSFETSTSYQSIRLNVQEETSLQHESNFHSSQ